MLKIFTHYVKCINWSGETVEYHRQLLSPQIKSIIPPYVSVYKDNQKWRVGRSFDIRYFITNDKCLGLIFNSYLEAQKVLDEQLIIEGFKLLNNKEEVDKYSVLI